MSNHGSAGAKADWLICRETAIAENDCGVVGGVGWAFCSGLLCLCPLLLLINGLAANMKEEPDSFRSSANEVRTRDAQCQEVRPEKGKMGVSLGLEYNLINDINASLQ